MATGPMAVAAHLTVRGSSPKLADSLRPHGGDGGPHGASAPPQASRPKNNIKAQNSQRNLSELNINRYLLDEHTQKKGMTCICMSPIRNTVLDSV